MKKIIEVLDRLIAESPALQTRAREAHPPEADLHDLQQRYTHWKTNSVATLRYAAMAELGEEFKSVANATGSSGYGIAMCTGLLESARDLLQHGFIGNVRHLVHAELFDSLLDQSQSLLESGHRIPAAVLGRIVIERWLRDQADKASIPSAETAKPAVLNDSLKLAGAFSVPKWRQIQTCLDVGNAAAHGKESEFSADDVSRLLDFSRITCL
jgi:hypothetical protein